VEQGERLQSLVCPLWVHQGGDDAYAPVCTGFWRDSLVADMGNTMAGGIIGVEALGLEGEEYADPLILVRQVDDQAAVLPYAIVFHEPVRASLVHVDIVDAISRNEAEELVSHIFRAPALAKGIDLARLHGNRFGYVFLHQFIEVVILSRDVMG